jgi:hypothetical protein
MTPRLTVLTARTGADVESKDYTGWTSLHHAAFNGHVDVVLLLLEWGMGVQRVYLHRQQLYALISW